MRTKKEESAKDRRFQPQELQVLAQLTADVCSKADSDGENCHAVEQAAAFQLMAAPRRCCSTSLRLSEGSPESMLSQKWDAHEAAIIEDLLQQLIRCDF